MIIQAFALRRKSLYLKACTRQGSNLQPCDPKSYASGAVAHIELFGERCQRASANGEYQNEAFDRMV
jgi:hypothetical protein